MQFSQVNQNEGEVNNAVSEHGPVLSKVVSESVYKSRPPLIPRYIFKLFTGAKCWRHRKQKQ